MCLLMAGHVAHLRRRSDWRADLHDVATYLAMLSAYTLVGAALVGYPLRWMHDSASLGAALGISAALVLTLLLLWRVWPAFGLTGIDARHRRSASPRAAPRGPLAVAWELTADNEMFFGHGLVVALALCALTQGAFVVSGMGMPLAPPTHWIALVIYALLALPLSWIVVRYGVWALRLDRRRERGERLPQRLASAPATNTQVHAIETDPGELARFDPAPGDFDAMLLRCVRTGQTQLALAALDHGADPNGMPPTDDRDQRSALVLSVLNPDLRLLRGFIAKGASLQRVHAGLPVLIAATRDSREGRADAVMTLLTNGAPVNCADAEGNTPLHFAALSATPIVAALLCDAGARLDAINREQRTPLALACAAANWDLVRFLLERGSSVEVAQAQPALIAAAAIEDDDPTGVALLLKRKARVDARDVLQRTALMTAALHGHAEIAQTLVNAGASLVAADAHGTTPLMEAARTDAQGVLDVLIPLRPPPDAVDHAGRSALMIAAQSLRASELTVQRLLRFGISRQLVANDGRRAVDFAASAGRWNIVALIDPEYPLPSNLGDATAGPLPAAEESPEHLLDALRFGHWQVVERFAGLVREWPSPVCAQLFSDLVVHPDPATRRWLLGHGLDAGAIVRGRSLWQQVLDHLPASLPAATDLVEAGAQPAGSDVLVRLCRAVDATRAPSAAIEAFARNLLERGAEMFRADIEGRSLLAWATATGLPGLCAALLDRGADPQARDRHGRTPLFAALSAGEAVREALVKMLLVAGADPEVRAANGETPLGIALARGHANVQRWLNWSGWKLPRRGLREADVIAAARAGDADAVGKLLDLGLSADAVDGHGASALMHACARGSLDVATLLLVRGANSAHSARDDATALSAAVAARQERAVEMLIARGAPVDQKLAGGGTVLMAAAGRGDGTLVATLLAHGAHANAADEHGMRALHAAAQFAFASGDEPAATGVICRLLDAGAQVDARNSDGQTALLILLGARAQPRSGTDQKAIGSLLRILMERGARIDLQDERGVGALHACAMHGLLLPSRKLLAAGADPACRDIFERTPRDVAHLLGFIDVAAELGGDRDRRRVI